MIFLYVSANHGYGGAPLDGVCQAPSTLSSGVGWGVKCFYQLWLRMWTIHGH